MDSPRKDIDAADLTLVEVKSTSAKYDEASRAISRYPRPSFSLCRASASLHDVYSQISPNLQPVIVQPYR